MTLRRWLERRRTSAVILSPPAPSAPRSNARLRRQNVVERPWSRLKNGSRIATRHDRLARTYLASLALVSAVVIAWS